MFIPLPNPISRTRPVRPSHTAARASAMSLPLSTTSTARGTTCRSQKPTVTVYPVERLQRNSRPDRTLLS